MAEAKTDDDDDESFGDFTFASFPNQTFHSVPINGQNSSTTDNADDDEWGDFVEYPLRSEPPKASDPFGFFSDHSTKPSQSVEPTVGSGNIQWVKPKGALPLSIFGDSEEEEESGVVDPSVDYADKHAGNVKNESNNHLGFGINDIIANLYVQTQQIKDDNGLNSNSNGSSLNLNGTNSDPSGIDFNMNGSSLNLNDANSDPSGVDLNLNGLNLNPSGLNLSSDLVGGNGNLDIIRNLHNGSQEIKAANGFTTDSYQLESDSNLRGLNSDFNWLNSNLGSGGGNEQFDDDDGWEFKDAYSESKVEDGNDKKLHEFSEVTTNSSGFDDGSHGTVDLFTASNGFSSKSHEMDIGFDFKPTIGAENGFISDSYFQSEWNASENGLNAHPLVWNADSDESFEEFEAGFSETRSKQEEEPKVNNLSHSEVEVLEFDGKNQGNEVWSENRKGAVPLSIFGEEELETDGSLNSEDVFMFKPDYYLKNVQSWSSNLSINDLVSNLYSQAEPIPSAGSMQEPTENGLDSSNRVFNSNLVGRDDDFDDGSWKFNDAVSQTAQDQTSLVNLGDAHKNFSSETKLYNYVDFYSKLKDELCFVARCHLDSLKKAQSTAGLSGEGEKVASLDEEIQAIFKELPLGNIISKDTHSEVHTPRDARLKEFLEVLHEQKFQVLDSEYNLSRRLPLAEKDLKSAIELIKHATTMLKILTLVSMEEQSNYVSTWSNMISVCAQELKHGAWIWKQSLEKNVETRILSEPKARRYILALWEIYRVVVVLEASVKLYKPWILLSSIDFTGIYDLLEECHASWSSSGLEETLPSMSDPVGSEDYRTVKALLGSINHIRDLDSLALGNHVFTQQESFCRLSVLTPGVVQDMKMVVWNEEHYFLKLANLWANLISCDPPNLPCLHVG